MTGIDQTNGIIKMTTDIERQVKNLIFND